MEPANFYFFVLPLGVLVGILVFLVFHFARKEERHERKVKKLMSSYVKKRLKQEKLFARELEKLQTLLREESIDQDTYSQMREMLEIGFEQRRQEARNRFGARESVQNIK